VLGSSQLTNLRRMANMDDPFKPPAATVMRPRPGAGRRHGADAGPLRPAIAATDYGEPVPLTAQEMLGTGLNPLVQAASALLLLAPHLRGTLAVPDLAGLRRQTLDEMRRFEERATSAGIGKEVALAARYALCAAIDEAVLSTPWGGQSEWAQQPLLIVLHREAYGGEKFFDMLERLSQDPTRHIDLMELQYLCLAFGFAGKYQLMPQGHARLAEVQHAVYQKIRAHRGTPQQELSLRWRGVDNRRRRLVQYVPWWVAGAAALLVMAVVYGVYYAMLDDRSAPVHAALANVGRDAFTATAAPVAPGPTLKQLLQPEEAQGTLQVEEDGGRTRITLTASDLFRSGSAVPNPAYAAMFSRVAAALNQVPGRVIVEGHTDDQPLRSLTYRNNFELSRDRAASVTNALMATLDTAGRIESTGLGSSEPRYGREVPDYRARNRRVEIIHVRGS
jgi:type VI secretion system protein ImpK